MLEYHEHDTEDIIEIIVDGMVSRDEYEKFRDSTEAFIKKRGRVRLLEVFRNFGPVDPQVIWEDAQFAFRHLNDFSRVAVVAEEKWLATLLAAAQKLFVGEVKAFTLDECQAAWDWLTEHATNKTGRPRCLEG